ncbi:MAG: 3-oxoacyl-ACP reductase family protein [Acidimicrobiia bacterium]|nr:3-oxoacyl-ACP reductase family protein [Acidimicrobiia bacterium]
MDFSGRRVLITGASRGLGRTLAVDLASKGASVIVNYNRSPKDALAVVAEIQASGGEAHAVQADVGKSDDVVRLFSEMKGRLGGIDVLINNAGINADSAILDLSEGDWDSVIETNLKGPFLCSQQAARLMISQAKGYGRIINMSANTSLRAREGSSNYAASKAGVNALTRALAVELGSGITANTIALGFLDSPLLREVFTADHISGVEEQLPSGQLGTFAHVSALVAYLMSDEAAFITGQTIALDGGQTIKV